MKLSKKSHQKNKSLKMMMQSFMVIAFLLGIMMPSNADIKPGKKRATLILSDGSKIELNGNDTIVNSNVKGIKIKVDSLGISYQTEKKTPLVKKS